MPITWKHGTNALEGQNTNCSSSYKFQETVQTAYVFAHEFVMESFFTILKDYASQNNLLKAFGTFILIQLHTSTDFSGIIPLSVSSLLLSCINLKLVPQGKQLHAHIISLGLERHLILVPKLVTFYLTHSSFVDARIVIENSRILHSLPWNILISAYVRNGQCREAIFTYKQMVAKGVRCDGYTYPTVIKACAEERDLEFGRVVHKSVEDGCHKHCLYVQNALVTMYGRCGEHNFARKLFDAMSTKDAISWNSIISCYASNGMWKDAFGLFENMQAEGVVLNIITWNTIAGGYIRTGNFGETLALLSQMKSRGILLDSVAILHGLGACSHIGALKWGRAIHGLAVRSCVDRLENLKNALITMYSRCGDFTSARVLFQFEEKTVITWNSIISGHAHLDQYEEASFLFRQMLLLGIEPNYVTIASLLPLCARAANLQHGKEFHCYVTKHAEIKNHLNIWNALVDMYARSGKNSVAKTLFDSLSVRDEVTYTALIAGYGMQGEGRAALKLFEEMNVLKIKPDHITMVSVLSACSHSGLVTQGEFLFGNMKSRYGITPRLEHFACMVDLFGRAGFLDKAKEMFMKMPYMPTHAMWATLLGACQIYRNNDMGEWAAEKLLEVRPVNSGYYVLIANMYGSCGRWDKYAYVRSLMRDSGVNKPPGCAWIDSGLGFKSFLVADRTCSHAHKIYPLLHGLAQVMKDVSYVDTEDSSLGDSEEMNEFEFSNRCLENYASV